MKAYKLMRQKKNGELTPLFINKSKTIPVGQWLPAEVHPTKGFALRPGWHVTPEPTAPHLSEKGRVWVEVEVEGVREFKRPAAQGGMWYLADRMKVVRVMERGNA